MFSPKLNLKFPFRSISLVVLQEMTHVINQHRCKCCFFKSKFKSLFFDTKLEQHFCDRLINVWMDKNKIKRYQFPRHVTLNFFLTNDWNNANPRKSCQNRYLLIQMLHDSLNRYTRNLYGYEDSLHDRIVNDIFTEVLKPWPDKKQTVIYQLNGHPL